MKTFKEYFHAGNGDLIAIQGTDGVATKDDYSIFIANGYRNSLGFIDDKDKIKYNKVFNLQNSSNIELFADVFYKNNNEIYWTSYRNNSIYKSDSKLILSNTIFAKNFLRPIGIDGNQKIIVVADQGNHEIVCLNYKGEEIWRKKYYINFKLQKNPYGVTFFEDSIYITISLHENLNIIKINDNGDIKDIIFNTSINNKKFSNIQSIDADTFGNIYFHDTGNKRILSYDKNMKFLNVFYLNEMNIGRGLSILQPKNLIVVSGFKNGRKLSSEYSGIWILKLFNN